MQAPKIVSVVASAAAVTVIAPVAASRSTPAPPLHDPDLVKLKPSARVGVVADIQYADLPDGHNYNGKVKRMYRGSLEMLKRGAVPYWNQDGGVDLVVQLGDIIDGACTTSPALDGGASGRALSNVMSTLAQVGCGIHNVHHLIGNHELYNFDRETLRVAFGLDGSY